MTATATKQTDEIKGLEKEIAKLEKMAESRARLVPVFARVWAGRKAYQAAYSAWETAYSAWESADDESDEPIEPAETWSSGKDYAAIDRAGIAHLADYEGSDENETPADVENHVMHAVSAWVKVPGMLIAERRARIAMLEGMDQELATEVWTMIDECESLLD